MGAQAHLDFARRTFGEFAAFFVEGFHNMVLSLGFDDSARWRQHQNANRWKHTYLVRPLSVHIVSRSRLTRAAAVVVNRSRGFVSVPNFRQLQRPVARRVLQTFAVGNRLQNVRFVAFLGKQRARRFLVLVVVKLQIGLHVWLNRQFLRPWAQRTLLVRHFPDHFGSTMLADRVVRPVFWLLN